MLESFAGDSQTSTHDEEALLRLVRTLQKQLDDLLERYQREQSDEVTSAVVRGVIAARQRRLRYFDKSLFNEPAWDILLELFACEIEDKPISITSLCYASLAAPTTALRWFCLLEERGFLRREPDKVDGRRQFVHLTSVGNAALNGYFLDHQRLSEGGS